MMSSNTDINYLEPIPGLDPDIIDVVYALPDYQHIFKVRFSDFSDPNNITLLDAIKKSGILQQYPEIDLSINSVGVNSEVKNLSDFVKMYDRIEIYRPLTIDPVEARRLRAKRQAKKS